MTPISFYFFPEYLPRPRFSFPGDDHAEPLGREG
jgi:hypothetical protein